MGALFIPNKTPAHGTGIKEGASSGSAGNRNSVASVSAALLLTPQGLGQYQRMFHTRALDYEPLVAVVVEMLQGALVDMYILI